MISYGDLNAVSMLSDSDWKKQNPLEAAANIAGATLVDIGVSMWNSIIPEATGWETTTRNVLQSIGADGAVSAYDNNRDTVEALSFVGGIFIPGGAALKLSKAVRAGMKGTSFLSATRSKDDLIKFEGLIENGLKGTNDYRTLRNQIFIRGQANNLLDSAMAELAVMGTFNAHPFMEDYMEDPVSNFAVGMALGGTIGGGLSFLASKAEVGGILGKVETAAAGKVSEAAQLFSVPYADTASTLTYLNTAAKNLDSLATQEGTNQLTKDLATAWSGAIKAQSGDLFKSNLGPSLAGADKETLNRIKQVVEDPRFLGAEKFDFFKPSEMGFTQATPDLATSSVPLFRTTALGAKGQPVEKFTARQFYSQDLGAFVSAEDAQRAATAADLFTPNTLPLKNYSIKELHDKFPELSSFGRTADVEAEYLGRMAFYDKLSVDDLAQVEIFSGDLPAMNGWVAAYTARKASLEALVKEGGAESTKAMEDLLKLDQSKVKVYTGKRVELVNLEQVDGLPTASIDPADYIKPTYFQDMQKEIDTGAIKPLLRASTVETAAISKDFYSYVAKAAGTNPTPKQVQMLGKQYARENADRLTAIANAEAGLSPEATLVLARIAGGAPKDRQVLQGAMASARTLRNGLKATGPYNEELANILESPITKSQQATIASHSDAKGNMYIRGSDTAGTYNLENKGLTYKVHKDDVVGYISSDGGNWLVGTKTTKASSGPKVYEEMGVEDLAKSYLEQKGKAASEAIAGGMPKEVAALRYNMDKDIVDLVASNPYALTQIGQTKGISEALTIGNRWNSPAQVEDALSASRRTLEVSAKKFKTVGEFGAIQQKFRDSLLGKVSLTSQEKAALNSGDSVNAARLASKVNILDEQFATINKLWVETSVMASGSKLLNSMMNEVVDSSELKALKEGIKEFVNGKGGNPLYSSADFVTSRMGYAGKLATTIGDRRTHLANKVFEELMEPVSNKFRALMSNEAARTEFAIFDNIRQSTKGFIQYDSELRTFVTGDLGKDGKIIAKTKTPISTYTVQNQDVHDVLLSLQNAGNEVWKAQAGLNRIKGVQTPSNIGFWTPSVSYVNKHLAYVINHDHGSAKVLVGNSEEDLKSLMKAYNPATNETILTRQEYQQTKQSAMGDLLDDVTRSDTDKLKKGVGLVAPDTSPDRLAEIVSGFRDRINYQASNFVENATYDVQQQLSYLSSFNKKFSETQGTSGFLKSVKQISQKDTAADIRDILLGKNPVHRSDLINNANKVASATIQVGINAFSRAYESATSFIPFRKEPSVNYEAFAASLKAQGISDPFQVFHDAARPLLYERAKNSGYSVTPERIINAGNAIASTLALRFLEVAQPLVNAMSMPILSISTINRAVKEANINNSSDLLKASPLATMYNGIRRMNSKTPENLNYLKMFEEEGLLQPIISEADEVIKLSRFGTGSLVGGLEKALDSKFIQLASKPSDIGETFVRKATLMTGVELAKRIYGNAASERQVALFARDFMKQSLGNYSTSQRPMMFQGSFGSAMGLFQTYMLTYAQAMYRHLDLKDYKGLGQTMLAQGGIFGAGSLPGFQQVSAVIGEEFSDEHFDLTTGTYRALPSGLADVILYGLPSNFAPDVHTRGDVSPRVPTSLGTLVGPSMVAQTLDAFVTSAKSMAHYDVGAGQAFMEALATQSVSRPIARLSELASGYSITGKGRQVAGPEEVWSWQGILARVMSTRPLAESKVRETIHLDSYYGAIDKEARSAVLERLRTAIRSDKLDNSLMDDLAYDYMRTGSPQGFRQAVNQAIMENSNDKLVDLTNRFGNSPLMLMVDDLD